MRSGEWLELAGRVIVVTGSAGGIGLAVAKCAASVGASVALLDRQGEAVDQAAQELRSQGIQAIGVECDVSDPRSVRNAADLVRNKLGAVSGLINCAGMLQAANLQDVALDVWNKVLSVNLTGYLLCAQAFGRDMLDSGKGSMVHIASVGANFPQTRGGAYSASKAGVLALSQQLATEWGARGVRSNAISPGLIRTPLSAKFYENPDFEARRAAATASRRVGEPRDIAEPALFLLSDRAAYVNGAELVVDGGLTCMLLDMVPRPGYNNV